MLVVIFRPKSLSSWVGGVGRGRFLFATSRGSAPIPASILASGWEMICTATLRWGGRLRHRPRQEEGAGVSWWFGLDGWGSWLPTLAAKTKTRRGWGTPPVMGQPAMKGHRLCLAAWTPPVQPVWRPALHSLRGWGRPAICLWVGYDLRWKAALIQSGRLEAGLFGRILSRI
jgi:hypothetical protein